MNLIARIRASLRLKLTLATIAIVGSMLILLLANTWRHTNQSTEKQAELRITTINVTLNQTLASDVFLKRYADINAKLKELIEKSPESFVYMVVLDDSGKLIAQAGQVSQHVQPDTKIAITTNDAIAHASYPLTVDSLPVGTVRYGLSLKTMLAVRDGILRESMLISAFTLVALVLAVSLMSYWLTRDLKLLARKAQALVLGHPDEAIAIHTNDEVGILAQSFHDMATAVRMQFTSLHEQAALLNLAHDAIIVRDMDNTILFWNRGAEITYGWSQAEVLGRVTYQLLNTAFLLPLIEIEKILYASGQWEGELEHSKADGSRIIVTSRWAVQRNAQGHPTAIMEINRDITDRVRVDKELRRHQEHLEELVQQRTAALVTAKEEAERANAAKSEFLSRMSHELRTPMNAILGFSQVLEIEDINPEQLDCVQEIHRAGTHLLQLINELLDLSRIESGKMVTALQPVKLSVSVAEALQITKTLIQAQHITCLNQCNARDSVLADPTRLKQILVNFLSNAAKYNRDGGRILIECQQRPGDILRLCVSDDGQGIPPEKHSYLFKPFERLGAEHSAVDGTGIGLALSKQLAELMGGTLGFESAPGAGSTFWVELPQTPTQENGAALAQLTPDSANGPRHKVLYIEDNAANLKLVEAMFRHQQNLLLLSATNGEYGLELARLYHPDVILLDIHLPGMSGYAVLEALQIDAATNAIPVLALSADAMPIDIERGLQAGFAQYLTKPIKIQELLNALNSVLNTNTNN